MSPGSAPHFLHVFSTFVPAGPEIRTVQLINALGTRYRHSILAIDGRTDAASQLSSGVNATVLPAPPRAGTARTTSALRKLMKRESPDLVLSYNWGAFDSVLASCSLLRRKRHIHHEDGFNADEAQGFIGRRVRMRRATLPYLSRVVVPSHLLAGVARDTWKLHESKVKLIPNGIDLEQFSARDGNPGLRAKLGIAPTTPVIGFVGHLRPVKNPVRLIQAFARLHTRTLPALVMLGTGPEHGAVMSAATRLGVTDRVHLVGHQQDTAPWYRMMDLFAISSDSEQMPVALLEAMASSLPVASVDVGDVSHMLPDSQADFVVGGHPDGREGELARAMDALLTDSEGRELLGATNRKRAEESYSFETMLASYKELYDATLNR